MNEDSLYNRLSKGILTDEEIDNLVDEIMNIPSEKNNNCASTYGSINVDDLISNVKEFKKIPTFDNLLKENQQLKEQQKEFIEYLQNNIESLEFCDNEFILSNHKKEIKAYKEILSKYKEIVGDK